MIKKDVIWSVICIIFLNILGLCAPSNATENPFPLYPCIEPNVKFWTEIYSEHPTTKGVLHDSNRVQVIYEVIDLVAPEKPGARKINKRRIKAAKNKYKKILQGLARNSPASDPETRRVASLFGPGTGRSTFQRAVHQIRCQVGQKDRFREGFIRSGAYIEAIKRIFHDQGLPVDLAYLPHVESSFNPKAYSKSGAAGIWQFTRATGKQFLNVGYALDERLNPLQSSKAAAKLLKHNYKRLGNWPMAITAYNYGITAMLKAKMARGGYEAIFRSEWSRRFRFASRNFYAELLAAREVAKNAMTYFGPLELNQPVETRTLLMEGYASITDLCRQFQVDIDTMRELNLSLRAPVFKGQKYVPKGYALRLPFQHVDDMLATSGKLPEIVYQPRQKNNRYYRVKKGDTVGMIAKVHGIRTSALMVANGLDTRGTIYAGQQLLLPGSDEKHGLQGTAQEASPLFVTASLSRPSKADAESQRERADSTRTTIPASELPVSPAVVGGDLEIERVVFTQENKRVGIIRAEIGETLGHYAEWLRIPAREIERLNGLSSQKALRLHQEVKIPLERVTREQFEEARLEYHRQIQEDFFSVYRIETFEIYRVKNGDNIWTLANEVFRLPLWLVKKYNPQVDFTDLRRSQKLAIPVVEKIVADNSDVIVLE